MRLFVALENMLKRLFVIVLLAPLLVNGVWASVHLTEDDHHLHTTPHLHFDTEIHSIDERELTDSESSEHGTHEHVHIYLNAYIKTEELNYFEKRNTTNQFGFNSIFISLIPSPPVPPPNI